LVGVKPGRFGHRLEREHDTRFLQLPKDLFQPSVEHAIVGLKTMQTRKANAQQTLEITVHICNALGFLLILVFN
jgi:hypothetical protein